LNIIEAQLAGAFQGNGIRAIVRSKDTITVVNSISSSIDGNRVSLLNQSLGKNIHSRLKNAKVYMTVQFPGDNHLSSTVHCYDVETSNMAPHVFVKEFITLLGYRTSISNILINKVHKSALFFIT
jgi:hypothetical protein